MCGITGFIASANESNAAEVLADMIKTLSHRGPDDNGGELFGYEDYVVALGQTRLAIIDLSGGGHQPMHYDRYSIVFNGEIYNYREIRRQLEQLGHSFVSQSDTEVILHAYAQWGKACVHEFIGMFAFVIFDREAGTLWCCRDRAGVKPFYYYYAEGLFMFASELKAFHAHPRFKKELDYNALSLYFHYGYIPAPYTIFRHTYKLEPGHSLLFSIAKQSWQIEAYWSVTEYYRKPKLDIGYEEAKQELNKLLASACNYRMVADVPVGVFLSGGYDSSSVAAILQKDSTDRLKTFTIGFPEGNNEAPQARAIAEYLGTDHSEFICMPEEAKDIIPMLPYFYDEPFADSSAIPTMLVSRIARQHVTVALSADAGDEVFAGYTSYASLSDKLNLLNAIPASLKMPARMAVRLLERCTPHRYAYLKHRLDGVAHSLNTDTFQQAADLFRLMNSLPESYSDRLFTRPMEAYPTPYLQKPTGFQEPLDIALAMDYQMYLPNDILTKVDRATMSVALEGREPLLDHRLVEFAAQLPVSFKYDGNTGKKILKDIVHQYIPETMMNRPKAGFSLPIYSWLRHDLSYLTEHYLSQSTLQASGVFQMDFVTEQVALFKANKLHYKPFIWKLLMFQMWFERWF
ncbi:asparagine synthase (glutamine-hydrolyzing) [Rhodoflexus caldus]|uniref:asparagine synthase (glutamine-hydrolyzing) n=1 Tax=Rhodoflexus caldus TaxID=2891236 RepID=UPI002029B9C5|nr:asparagine synthase (glutamine-hydrolyzing) [Rhodoflexus caldus]